MFRLQLHQLIFVYAGFCLAIILLAAWFHNMRRTRRDRAALHDLMKCGLCAYEFRDETEAAIPRCPNCNALVERRHLSRL